MSEVFISYSRDDHAVAAGLAADLARLSINTWWDFELFAGQDFHDAILTALDGAKAVVVIWSDTAARSPWVRDEATRAARYDKLITTHLPGFDLANLPLGFGQRHSIEVTERSAVVRALSKHGISPNREIVRSDAERGRELLARLREMKARHQAREANGATDQKTDRMLGIDPESNRQVTLRSGRFGPYVELAEQSDGDQPKRATIPRDLDVEAIDLVRALQLLSLPREVGKHPESGKPIIAGLGRYGPYLYHDGVYANLNGSDDVFTVSLNLALALLAERGATGSKSRPWQPPVLVRELGDHPIRGGAILILSGRFGPYVKHGTTNATVPRGIKPEELTLAHAIELIAERENRNQ